MKQLNLIEKAFFLKNTHLFCTLDLDLLLTIADKLELLFSPQGEKIFHIDQEAHKMYVIYSGQVEILDARDQKLSILSVGEFFGDEALFNERTRRYTAISTQPTFLLALAKNHLLSIISECPSVAIALLEAYAAGTDFRAR